MNKLKNTEALLKQKHTPRTNALRTHWGKFFLYHTLPIGLLLKSTQLYAEVVRHDDLNITKKPAQETRKKQTLVTIDTIEDSTINFIYITDEEIIELAKARTQAQIDRVLEPYSQRIQAQAKEKIYTLKLVNRFFKTILFRQVPQSQWAQAFQEVLQRFHQLGIRLRSLAQKTQDTDPSGEIQKLILQAESARRDGNLEEAERVLEEAFQKSLKVLRYVQDRHQNSIYRTAQIRAEQAGNLLARRQYEEAAKHFYDAFILHQNDASIESMNWLIKAGDMWQIIGRSEESLKIYERARGFALSAQNTQKYNPKWQQILSLSYSKVADAQDLQGELKMARSNYEKAIEILDHLPGTLKNTALEQEFSKIHLKLCDLQIIMGDLPAAQTSNKIAFDSARKLAYFNTQNPNAQEGLAMSYLQLGRLQNMRNDRYSAQKNFESGFIILKKLYKNDPQNREWLHKLSVYYRYFGEFQKDNNLLSEAQTSFESGLSLAKTLSDTDPNHSFFKYEFGYILYQLSAIQKELGDNFNAQRNTETSLKIFEFLNELNPKNLKWQGDFNRSPLIKKPLQACNNKDLLDTRKSTTMT